MQKKCLQKNQQKPKNQNFEKWVFANPGADHPIVTYYESCPYVGVKQLFWGDQLPIPTRYKISVWGDHSPHTR